jgi:hypothetical protein
MENTRKSILALIALLGIVCVASVILMSSGPPRIDPLAQDRASFNFYISKFGKSYTSDEYEQRLFLFSETAAVISAHNRSPSTYKLEINEFADLTDEEFNERYTVKMQRPSLKSSE